MYWRAIAVCSSFGGLVAMVAARNSEGGNRTLPSQPILPQHSASYWPIYMEIEACGNGAPDYPCFWLVRNAGGASCASACRRWSEHTFDRFDMVSIVAEGKGRSPSDETIRIEVSEYPTSM